MNICEDDKKVNFNKNKYRASRQILKILSKPHQIPRRIMNKGAAVLSNFFLNKKCYVKLNGKRVFTLRDFGEITKMRIVTFSTKEPETLKWISNFEKNDQLLDIGANVGVYSLYAAVRGHTVISIEPNALNFALLNLNILDNDLGKKITAYPYAVHSDSKISLLNNGLYKWGGAVSTFDRNVDWLGENLETDFKQGSPGISVDDFVEGTGFIPNHIKIDVDGNELFVLLGAKKTLCHPNCKSILVELFDNHPEYKQCIEIIATCGFQLIEKTHSLLFKHNILHADNHIFVK